MGKNLTGLIWDVGGVIVNFDQSIIDKKLAADTGKSVEEVSAILFGGTAQGREYNAGITEPFYLGKINAREFYESLQREMGVSMSFGEFVDTWCEIFTPNIEIIEYIRRAHDAKVPQCILSSTNPLQMEKMASMGNLAQYIGKERFVTSYGVGKKKPDRMLFDVATNTLGLPRVECVYIDDVAKYVQAAEVYGLAGVHVDLMKENFQQRCLDDLAKLGFKI